ncbi:DNA adenine methylase [Noviherbaspirillum saxi]|nr:DNA adenine methylase [Noviherbaspirillum saxi]
MPHHRVYIESHLGGGAVLRNKQPVEHSIGIDADSEVVRTWADHDLPNTQILEGDAIAFLSGYDYRGDELVYCDPPYPVSTRRKARIYRRDYSTEDHLQLLEVITKLPCMVMISSYSNPIYEDVLRDWEKITFNAATHSGIREESVWINFPMPEAPYDTRYLGADFRQREALRRRHSRLADKIMRMPLAERHLLWSWAAEQYSNEIQEAVRG